MHTVKIYTTDRRVLSWVSLRTKLLAIEGILNTAKNANFKVSIAYTDFIPEVKDGRITHASLDALWKGTYDDFVLLHMTDAQRTEWGIKPSLRGSRHNDSDDVGEMYFWADENTRRGRFNQFIETCLHEIRHELCAGTKTVDDTHTVHDAHGTLREQFRRFDMATYRPVRAARKALLTRALQEIVRRLRPEAPKSLHKRFYKEYRISQGYGVLNGSYRITGRHIGIDYATPVGTPVLAPWDGSITEVGTHTTFGHYCHFSYTFNGRKRVERLMHLREVPKKGTYKRGQELCYTGNTGFSTGPHLHVDGWWDRVNIAKINPENWDSLTYYPHID